MHVSFIIPLYNCLELTRACVASLQATLPAALAHEIILIDDGSTDGTRDWLATLQSPFRVLLNERNLGYAATNNRAIAVARGEHVALLNNDLVLLPQWLEPMLTASHRLGSAAGLIGNIQLNARTGAVDHAGIIINRQGKPEHQRQPPSIRSRWLNPVRIVPAVTGACLLTTRQLWQQLGGFDEGFYNGGEDIDLCFRARAIGRVNAVALRSVVRHHVSASPGRKLRDEENSYRLVRRWHRQFVAAAPEATRHWCRDYLAAIFSEPRSADYSLARDAVLHAAHLRSTPPPQALLSLEAGLGREFARWKEMFGQTAAKEAPGLRQ
jgi:GT2 family glycosyltransferase